MIFPWTIVLALKLFKPPFWVVNKVFPSLKKSQTKIYCCHRCLKQFSRTKDGVSAYARHYGSPACVVKTTPSFGLHMRPIAIERIAKKIMNIEATIPLSMFQPWWVIHRKPWATAIHCSAHVAEFRAPLLLLEYALRPEVFVKRWNGEVANDEIIFGDATEEDDSVENSEAEEEEEEEDGEDEDGTTVVDRFEDKVKRKYKKLTGALGEEEVPQRITFATRWRQDTETMVSSGQFAFVVATLAEFVNWNGLPQEETEEINSLVPISIIKKKVEEGGVFYYVRWAIGEPSWVPAIELETGNKKLVDKFENPTLSEPKSPRKRQRADSGVGSTCHQCHSKREPDLLCFCSRCVLKYCKRCMDRNYETAYIKEALATSGTSWLCPKCHPLVQCCCVSCLRRRQEKGENVDSSKGRHKRKSPNSQKKKKKKSGSEGAISSRPKVSQPFTPVPGSSDGAVAVAKSADQTEMVDVI